MVKQRTEESSPKPRLPHFFFGAEARRALEDLLPCPVIEEIEQSVERCVSTPWLLRLSRGELGGLKRSVDSLLMKLRTQRTSGWYNPEGITFAIKLPRNPSSDVTTRTASEMLEASRAEVLSPRPPTRGAQGIPIRREGRVYWIELPILALDTFSKDLSWLLGELKSSGGRPTEDERGQQALAVAQTLMGHGLEVTKTDSGLFAHVLALVLDEAGYHVPDDLRPVVAAAVDRLHREAQ